ncbi:MAG: hypothetical protein Q8R57_15515 [Bacteroidota bacterium]|nr:hypothetical protein [Bacteroidota bacterium]
MNTPQHPALRQAKHPLYRSFSKITSPRIFTNNIATNARMTSPRMHEYFCQLPEARSQLLSAFLLIFVHPTKHNIKKMFGALNKME